MHEELYIIMYEASDVIFTVTVPLKDIGFMLVSSKVQIWALYVKTILSKRCGVAHVRAVTFVSWSACHKLAFAFDFSFYI